MWNNGDIKVPPRKLWRHPDNCSNHMIIANQSTVATRYTFRGGTTRHSCPTSNTHISSSAEITFKFLLTFLNQAFQVGHSMNSQSILVIRFNFRFRHRNIQHSSNLTFYLQVYIRNSSHNFFDQSRVESFRRLDNFVENWTPFLVLEYRTIS